MDYCFFDESAAIQLSGYFDTYVQFVVNLSCFLLCFAVQVEYVASVADEVEVVGNIVNILNFFS